MVAFDLVCCSFSCDACDACDACDVFGVCDVFGDDFDDDSSLDPSYVTDPVCALVLFPLLSFQSSLHFSQSYEPKTDGGHVRRSILLLLLALTYALKQYLSSEYGVYFVPMQHLWRLRKEKDRKRV